MADNDVERWADAQAERDAALDVDESAPLLDDLTATLIRATHFPVENVPKAVELIDRLIRERIDQAFAGQDWS